MAQQTINVGSVVNDGTGDTPRNGGIKINENFTELYAAVDTKLSTQAFTLVTESTTARTLLLSDAQKYLRCTNAGATTITVPPQVDVVWVAGTEIIVEQGGTGQVTIAAGAGVTIRTSQTLLSASQYSQLTLKQVASNEWVCGGDRQAA